MVCNNQLVLRIMDWTTYISQVPYVYNLTCCKCKMNQNNGMQCIIKMSPAIAAISEHCNKTIPLFTYPKLSLTMAEINKIWYTLEYSMVTLNTYVCELSVHRVKFCKFT
jgi:hypothetical protein